MYVRSWTLHSETDRPPYFFRLCLFFLLFPAGASYTQICIFNQDSGQIRILLVLQQCDLKD